MHDTTHPMTTNAPLDQDLRRRVAEILADGRALFGAQIEVSDQTLFCRWDPQTMRAYDRLEDAWEAALTGLVQDPAALELARAVYDAALAFVACREQEGFSDGYLCGRLGLAPPLGSSLFERLGQLAEVSRTDQVPQP